MIQVFLKVFTLPLPLVSLVSETSTNYKILIKKKTEKISNLKKSWLNIIKTKIWATRTYIDLSNYQRLAHLEKTPVSCFKIIINTARKPQLQETRFCCVFKNVAVLLIWKMQQRTTSVKRYQYNYIYCSGSSRPTVPKDIQ